MSIEHTSGDSHSAIGRSSTSVARVKRRTKKKWESDDNAMDLLGSILDDAGKAAEDEARDQAIARERAIEEERIRLEQEELQKRTEAEQALLEQLQEQEDKRQRQLEMQAAVQRQKDIESGIIDLEEEARIALEQAERERLEEENRIRIEKEKRDSQALYRAQRAEIEEFKQKEAFEQAQPKPSKAPLIAAIAVFVLIIAGATAHFGFGVGKEVIDIYKLSDSEIASDMNFKDEIPEMMTMQVSVVKQAADPAPVKRRRSSSKASAPAAPKPTLGGGKGGLSGGKRGGLFGGKRGL